MTEWQPIDTAPKDGSRILGWYSDPRWAEAKIVRWGEAEPFGGEKTWTTDSEGPGYSTGFEKGEITHWMPLPSSPKPLNLGHSISTGTRKD